MTFHGTYWHSMDERGRVAIPARFRRELQDGAVVRPAHDGCVEVYSKEGFDAEAERRLGTDGSQRPEGRMRRRAFFSEAFGVDLDRQGRIVIPQDMRETSGLEGQVAVVGVGDFIELWLPEAWEAAKQAAAATEGEELSA